MKMVEMTRICTLILLTLSHGYGSNAMQHPPSRKIINFLMKHQSLPEVNDLFKNTDITKDEEEDTLEKDCEKGKAEMSKDSSISNQFDKVQATKDNELPEFMKEKKIVRRKKTLREIMFMLKKLKRKGQAVYNTGKEPPYATGKDASDWPTSNMANPNGFNGTICEFLTDYVMAAGLCTQFGSCRVDEEDYMYQGGCGELSEWGRVPITNHQVPCTMRMDVKHVHHGWCTDDGYCMATDRIKEDSLDCFVKLIAESKRQQIKKKPNRKKQEKVFLPTLYKFLGGLGNALHFAYIKYS